MITPLRILLVEDNPDDEILISRELRKGGVSFQALRVETREQFCVQLGSSNWDVVIADYFLPGFSGLEALSILKEQRSLIPFILVSGTVGEEIAVESIQAGADDYLLKQNLIRLVPAVTRAIREASDRRQRRLAEQALKESRERLELIHNSVSDFLVFLTRLPDGRWLYTSANRAFLAKLSDGKDELSADELVGREAEDAEENLFRLDAETAAWFADLRQEAVIGGRPISSERELVLPAGRFVGEFQFIPVIDPDGACQHLLISGRDITLQRRAEEHERRLREQMVRTHKLESLGTLAGGIAHDFNNLLTGIFGFADLAKAATNLPDAHRQCEQIIVAANRARELIGRILTFSQRQPSLKRPLLVSNLVRELIPLVRASFPNRFEIDLQLPDVGPQVLGDAGQLHQALLNLCTNAAHAMPAGGRLTVILDEVKLFEPVPFELSPLTAGDYVKICVEDTGFGMDAETLRRAFEPFFTTKPIGQGTGLGLSVVHGIVREHHGHIRANSEPGKGTSFEILIPVAVQDLPTVAQSVAPAVAVGQRVMVVEDDLILADMTAQMLFRLGYQPTTYDDPISAFDAFSKSPTEYSVVLTDNRMPSESGVALAWKLSRIRSDLPIVLMTGAIEPEEFEFFQKLRNGILLTKPFTLETLAQAMNRAIQRVAPQPPDRVEQFVASVTRDPHFHEHQRLKSPRHVDSAGLTAVHPKLIPLSHSERGLRVDEQQIVADQEPGRDLHSFHEELEILKNRFLAEVNLHSQTRDALAASHELCLLASDIIHDVNNQLVVIYYSSQQLLEQLPVDDHRRLAVASIVDARAKAAERTGQFQPPKYSNASHR